MLDFIKDKKDDESHYEWANGCYYCNNHNAGFEFQEAFRNDSNCPWCGETVEDIIHD